VPVLPDDTQELGQELTAGNPVWQEPVIDKLAAKELRKELLDNSPEQEPKVEKWPIQELKIDIQMLLVDTPELTPMPFAGNSTLQELLVSDFRKDSQSAGK
jgi:hypothetical protein